MKRREDRSTDKRLKLVTGGQTGVDRAVLDAALKAGWPVGGWCPKGRRAEDGVIAARYPLKVAGSPDYAVRIIQLKVV